MNLLENAAESIKLGVEDFQQEGSSRLLSSVRNIHAGILLLYKEFLRRLSPEGSEDALLKSKIIPKSDGDGNIIFVGAGKKTVGIRQIKERFENLSIKIDWNRFDEISKIRNDVEHHYTTVNKKALQSVIANACIILRNFMVGQLKEDPMKLLGPNTWQAMLRIEEIYRAERKRCDDAMNALKWHSGTLAKGIRMITCSECNSDLLFPERESDEFNEMALCLFCRACGAEKFPESFVSEAVCIALAYDSDWSYADGGKMPYADCPQCFNETYVMKERKCALCDHQAEHTCKKCGKEIPSDEIVYEPYCGYCIRTMPVVGY